MCCTLAAGYDAVACDRASLHKLMRICTESTHKFPCSDGEEG